MKNQCKRCPRPAQTRGLCTVCYKRVYRLIQSGKTTWEKEGYFQNPKEIIDNPIKCKLCNNGASIRGLCPFHYNQINRLVLLGKTTWEEAGYLKKTKKIYKHHGKLCPRCPNEATIRGLCKSCYNASLARVKKGESTWRKEKAQTKIKKTRDTPQITAFAEYLKTGKKKKKVIEGECRYCNNGAYTRGLCRRCYHSAYGYIRKNKLMWSDIK